MADVVRGVFVLGVHRSGTSAVTRLVNLLGVPLCREADRLPPGVGNRSGHWESRSLSRRDEQLLHAVGAGWDCPPPVAEQSAAALLAAVRTGPARAAFRRSHPEGRWVWKDPRLCVLLPFWRAVLPGEQVGVLVIRHPHEVATSLASRDGLTSTHGVAIWERYLRHALVALAGTPTLVIDYRALVSDPDGTTRTLRGFLSQHGLAPNRAIARAAASVNPPLDAGHETPQLSAEMTELWERALALRGLHDALPAIELGPETPGLDGFFEPRRAFWGWCPTVPPRVSRWPGQVANYPEGG